MRTEGFNGILLSVLMTVSLMAPAITIISLLSVSPVSAQGPENCENIVRGFEAAYNVDGDATAPWKWYGPDEPEQRPPIMAANRVEDGTGAVVAAGFVAACWDRGTGARWTDPPAYTYLDVLLDNAFQWMVPGATTVLWYGEEKIDYNVYSDAAACSRLIAALEAKGYTVDNTVNGTFDNIDSDLLSLNGDNYDILVIPQMELGAKGTGGNPDELPDGVVTVIKSFVQAGGGLLIMDGYDSFGYNFCWVQNKILKAFEFGIYFQSDTIHDDQNYWAGDIFRIYAEVDNTTWIGSAYENATEAKTLGLYINCSLAPRRDYEVSASFSPEYQMAFPNTTVEYTVSVSAAGWLAPDNFNLEVTDNVWPATLENTWIGDISLAPKETTLTVTIPNGTAFGAEDEITVTITSQGDNTVSMEMKCKAIASMRIGPPVEDTYTTQWSQEYGNALGTYIWMQVGSDLDNNRRSYLKFDLSALPEGLIPPDGLSIDDISARLFARCGRISYYGAVGKNVQCLSMENDDWQEDVMYWGYEEPGFDNLLDTTKVSEVDLWYSWDVTSFVIQEFKTDPDNIASFCLKAETEDLKDPDAFQYYSFDTSNVTETLNHPYLVIGYDVSTWISPDYDGLAGGTLTYDINVWNRGSFTDSYTLYLENVWVTTLSDDRIVNLGSMETKKETLTVEIPAGAAIGDNDNILVTAISDGYPGENDIGTCIARASTHVSAWEDSSTTGRDAPPHQLENAEWGRHTSIYVGRYYEGPERGWLKFDLQAFPAGMTVARANLNLNCYSTYGANVRVYGVSDDSWSEYTINWLNKPPIDNVLDRRAVIENNKWYSWDVTDFVANEYAGDKEASFCLLDIGENIAPRHNALFTSKEYGENMPYLEILATAPENEVRAYVDPIFQGGLAGDTLQYIITIKNTGANLDNYRLTIENTENWSWTRSKENFMNMIPGENDTSTLTVSIPSDVPICTINDITGTVTSYTDNTVYDKIRCSAHRSGATLELENLYGLNLDVNALLREDAENLVAKFYTWGGGGQGENVAWITMPAHLISKTMKIPHPQGMVAVEKAELVLTDDGGATIWTLYTFVTRKSTLETRFMSIPMDWILAPPAEKILLETEFMEIPGKWILAPS